MTKFNNILKRLVEGTTPTKEEILTLLKKYGKPESQEVSSGKSIRFTVDLGSDDAKAANDVKEIQKITGRTITHLISNGKSNSVEVIIPNSDYKPTKAELEKDKQIPKNSKFD